ncbi:telomere repeat-binding protein 2-like [Phalaenopsis equestris]|uniref:telomere repeat-binding protein 2-like n=1 Tax=Phalaenopsis equestris TaxID=78828 RepID=UPI0009E50E4C|nr:telomere repeat-binding protein 2-like [Phalaenopsis equestris]
MVFQKRLDAGFIGCQIPTMPRFPRSARGKRSPQKKAENTQMHPFDMLATVAGELLAKRESSCSLHKTAEITTSGNTIKKEQLDHGSPSKSDVFDQGSCDESSFVARFVSHAENGAASDFAVVKSDMSKKDGFAWESAQSGLKRQQQMLTKTGTLKNDAMEIQKLDDPIDLDTKSPALLSSDSSIEIPPFGDYHSAHSSSLHSLRDGMDLILDRDDDENSSWRTHNSAIYSKPFKPHCKSERRVRKMSTTNSWKDDGEAMNDGELWHGDEEIKPAFRARNLCYTRRRTQRSSFKRKKLIERISFSAPDEVLVKDDTKLNSGNPDAELNDAHGRSCSTTEQSLSYESADHPVKLSIKSFRVPELSIEIPANATVGSLKRTVMEAVTAVLSGGLRVGVLLEGKKIRDDNKTLLQAGISSKDKLDNLGFALEPSPTRSPPPPCDSHSCESQPFNKIPDKVTCAPSTQTPPNIPENCTESDHDSVHSPTNPSSSVDQMCDNSKALVPILAGNSEALPVVPFRNSKLSVVVRRIRRPFSVSEVEALVQAVEKLGTGRWRDVKLRAFDNVKHRTYVDLKDKWKTLVHTARISPQQRRGEPVPQDLLDRVLSAHAYWGQQQAKSSRLAEPCLVLA